MNNILTSLKRNCLITNILSKRILTLTAMLSIAGLSTFPSSSIAQIFDEEITLAYYYRSLNNLPAVRKSNNLLDEINNSEFERITVPASIFLDLRLHGLDEKISIPFNAALERFNYMYAKKGDAINALEKIVEIQRLPTTYRLAAVATLAVITHNNGDYLKSIKYINWLHSYTSAKRHQLYYLLADNYFKIGDVKNAYRTNTLANELRKKYLNSGIDMHDELGIEHYEDMINILQSNLAGLEENKIENEKLSITIPEVSNKFWIVKHPPKFPKAALRKSRTGYVTVKFDLTSKGNPINITVVDTSRSIFKKPAMTFLKDLKYIQYAIPENGEVIATDIIYQIDFEYIK